MPCRCASSSIANGSSVRSDHYLLTGVICALRYDRPRDAVWVAPLQQALSFIQAGSSICALYYHFFREGPLRAGDCACDENLPEEVLDLPLMVFQEDFLPVEDLDVVLNVDERMFWDRAGNASSMIDNIASDSVIVRHEVSAVLPLSECGWSSPLAAGGGARLSLFDAYCEASNSGGENYFLRSTTS